jgi:hypothetical protein
LSYRRAGEATPSSGAATVTVCTNHLALCNLVEDALPAPIPEALPDAEFFVSEMVELEHDRVALATIDAGMLVQIGEQVHESLGDQGLLAAPCLVDVPLSMGSVVLLLVGGATGPAVVVPLPARFTPPSKVLQRPGFVAAPTFPHADKVLRREDGF